MRTGLLFISLSLLWGSLSATSARMEADRQTLPVGDIVSLVLTIVDDEKEDVVDIKEPELPGFEIEDRGESTSSSVSIINGKVSSRKERRITYVLRAQRPGQFTLGPAILVLEKGREVRSDQVRVTVTGTAPPGSPSTPGAPTVEEPGSTASDAGGELFAPLSAWEKQTGHFFVRVTVSPAAPRHQGEPLIVSYYLFTQKNLISDLSFYRLPSFENAWSEEIDSPRKLSFGRTNIGGTVYDHALLKRYVIVPEKNAAQVGATQMILEVMTGSFFDARKRTLSSIALSLDLTPLPDADRHPGGIVGDLSIAQDRTSMELGKEKPLDTITYTVTGCGDLHHLDLAPPPVDGLKLFAPDTTTDQRFDGTRLCGVKTFKFMVKAQRTGAFEIPAVTLSLYDRDKGWRTVASRSVTVRVGELAAAADEAKEAKKTVRYELLRELPAGIAVHDLTPFTARPVFLGLLAVPLSLLAGALLLWAARSLLRGRREREEFIRRDWERRIGAATDPATLLNTYYDAVAAVTGVNLRAERARRIEQRIALQIRPFTELAAELQGAVYAGGRSGDIAPLRERAAALLRTARRMT
ncbi:MAG TPA: BatD family protein [bacterium]|nr:BatD family protein [bacterium]